MMKARLLLISIVLFLFSCGEKDSDPIYNPTAFKISLKNSSFSEVEIEWSQSTIEDNSNLTYDVFLDGKLYEEGISYKKSYFFRHLDEKTSYRVKVVVNSMYETHQEASIDFTTKSTPVPSLLVVKTEELTDNLISLSWQAIENDLKYDVYLNDKIKAFDLDRNTFVFGYLEASTKYSIKIVSKNKFGKASNTTLDITTLDKTIPLSLTDFIVRTGDISSNTAIIKWDDSIASDGQTVEYIVYHPNNSIAMNRAQVNEFKIENLIPSKDYKYKVLAITQDSNVSKDAFVSFSTIAYEKPSDFVISVDEITTTSAKISWTASVLSDGTDLNYKVKVDGENKEFSDRELIITKLEPNTRHVIEVEAVSANNVSCIQSKEFSTLSKLSLSDFSFTAEQITQTSVVLKWTDCIASDGLPVDYTVFHPNGSSARNMTKGQECIIDILKANTEYTYKIVAKSYDLTVSKTFYVTFTTLSYLKPSDFIISVDKITESSAMIYWSESVLSNGDELTYSLSVDGVGRVFSGREFLIENLDANTEHIVVVKASSSNDTHNAQTMKFTTLKAKVYDLNVYSSEVKARSFVLNWDFDGKPGKLYYDIYFEGKWIKRDLSAASYSFDGLISNTSYDVKVVATDGKEKKYERIMEIKTAPYVGVLDFDVVIEKQNTYNIQTIDISDFLTKNSDRYDDILDMTSVFYLNDVKCATDVFAEITFENLKVNTEYNYKIKLFYADGSFAVEKTGVFTTCGNTAPVWDGELAVQYTGFSFVHFNKLTARDSESTLKYTYYVNGHALDGSKYVGNDRGDGQIDITADFIRLSHLTSDKNFDFYMTAEDETGEIIKSNTVSFKTFIDASLVFDSQLELVDGVYRLSWDKMGVSSSIKELRFEVFVDKVSKHNAFVEIDSELMNNGDKHYISKGLNQIIDKYAGHEVNFIVRIKWISGESIQYSISRSIQED